MEWFLSIAILAVLFLNFSNSKSRDLRTHELLEKLRDRVDALQKELSQKVNVSQENIDTAEKPREVTQPVVVPKSPVTEIIEPMVEKTPYHQPEKPQIVNPVPFQPKAAFFNEPEPTVVRKSWFETFKENNPDLEKFVGENLINKLGILILVLGISFFVKFAIAKDWINEPARVGIGVLCGALVMGIAHKLKKNYAAFSSVLVAGAISIFYFTIAIAFHEYQLFSQTVAFAIMTVITVFSVLVSVAYNRQELAVLSLIGGFAVPFMVSTGEGNYIVLFSYIALLNTGILAIAYFKKWKIVSILAFAFTAILFTSWYTRELYADQLPHQGALLFATLFYFIFSITTVVSNIRNKGVFTVPEYVIMIANTFLFFGLGMGIIHNWGINFKGLFTLSLAIYNIVYAVVLYRKFGLDKNAIYLLVGLALTFVTLTIPLQFDGNQITLFWAAEAVLLFWLSQKSKIERFKWGAVVVQILTILSLLMDWYNYLTPNQQLQIVFNPLFIAGIWVSISLFATYYLLKKETAEQRIAIFTLPSYKSGIVALAIVITYLTGFLEINYQAYQNVLNSASALSFPVTFHFIFVTILLLVARKMKSELLQNSSLSFAVFSILLYITVFYPLPNKEVVQNFVENTNYQYAFYFHYIVLGCLIYFGIELFNKAKQKPQIGILNGKWMPWFFVFATVYILSNEVMIHGLIFSKESIDVAQLNTRLQKLNTEESYIFYEKLYLYEAELNKIKTQIIKIGYPIVWGLFSFIFLIIGIRKQWKTLRIIALTLLGLTILKLFIYDINNVSETGKIVAFILLGVLILIISFVYQKVKKLVVDDVPKTNSDE